MSDLVADERAGCTASCSSAEFLDTGFGAGAALIARLVGGVAGVAGFVAVTGAVGVEVVAVAVAGVAGGAGGLGKLGLRL